MTKIIRIYFVFIAVLLAALSLLGCKSEDAFSTKNPSIDDYRKKIASIRIYPSNTIMKGVTETSVPVGFNQHYTAIATYHDGSSVDITNDSIWLSSDITVADSLGKGIFKGKKRGTTKVSASQHGIVSNEESLYVVDAVVVSLQLSPPEVTMPKGTQSQLSVTGELSNGTTVNLTDKVIWPDSLTDIASIDENGTLTAKNVGQTSTSVQFNSLSSNESIVTVTAPVVTALQVTPAIQEIAAGFTQQYLATAIFSDNTTADVSDLSSWGVSDSNISSVDGTGLVTTKKSGETQVTASYKGKSSSGNLSITQASLVEIRVDPSLEKSPVGVAVPFKAIGVFSDKTTRDLTPEDGITWGLDDNNLAIATNEGVVTGRQVGAVVITASKGNLSGNARLEITEAVLGSLQITPATHKIPKGTSLQYTATGIYTDNRTEDLSQQVAWISSDKNAAVIDENGVARAVEVTTNPIKITATYGELQGSADLEVTEAILSLLQITPTTATVPVGRTQQYHLTAIFSDGNTIQPNEGVSWISNNNQVATLSNAGLAQAIKIGSTVITATYKGKSITAELDVSDAVLERIQLTPAQKNLPVGRTQQYVATGFFSDNTSKVLTNGLSWLTNDSSIATISTSGVATAVAQGNVTVSVRVGDQNAAAELTVTAAVIDHIQVTPPTSEIPVGLSQQFIATGIYSDGTSQVINNAISWISSDPTIATIDVSGTAIGVSKGKVSIRATLDTNETASAELLVTDAALKRIQVTPAISSIPQGRLQQYTATGIYTDGSTKVLSQEVSWVTSDTSVSTISATGEARGLMIGNVVVTATVNATSGTANLAVTEAILEQIQVTPPVINLPIGLTSQYTATGIYSDGTTKNLISDVSWSTSNTEMATITTSGEATGVKIGTVTVIATLGTLSGTGRLNVTDAVLNRLAITPKQDTLPAGLTKQFSATAYYSDGRVTDVTNQVSWVSADTSIATVTSSGLVQGVMRGGVLITINLDQQSDTSDLTVSDAILQSLEVTPQNASIPKGLNQQYQAVGSFSNGETKDVTNQVSWSVENGNLATINSEGLAQGVNVGTTKITATLGLIKRDVNLQVVDPVAVRLEVTPATASVDKGNTQQYAAYMHYSDGTKQLATNNASWVSSDLAVATITSTGLATGVSKGQASITARYNGLTGSAQLTVREIEVSTLQVRPDGLQGFVGDKESFTLIVRYSNGAEKTLNANNKEITWSVAPSDLGSFDKNGVFTPLRAGSGRIIAVYQGKTDDAAVTFYNY
ncbi:Ig-like domain-containing protein [Vibrio mimicus]